jgi:hypothetical protein
MGSRELSPTFERHCPATPDVKVRSFADFLRFLERDAATTPDNHVTLNALVAERDRVRLPGDVQRHAVRTDGAVPADRQALRVRVRRHLPHRGGPHRRCG